MREVLAYSLLVVTSAMLLFIVVGILLYGPVYAYEPSLAILIFEVILLTGTLALGIERLISVFRRKR